MKLQYYSKIVSEFLLDLIYPRSCAVCGKVIGGYSRVSLCADCIDKTFIPKVVRDDRFAFAEAVAAIKYEGESKRAMIKYKFKSVKHYVSAYAYLADRAVETRPYFKKALMCCVPISVTRDREYSQTELVARELSRMWNTEFVPDLLVRCRAVSQISKMKLPQRKFFIRDSINVNPVYDICGRDILVIDDIFTSGTTADECAGMLKMYGAGNVYILCPCYD